MSSVVVSSRWPARGAGRRLVGQGGSEPERDHAAAG
ncbi:MAG: hypothetical protein KatS3mg108_3120 [Isosphaeraceae bacterium]|jgi:hypothetical protein|nr:MAG: hypothetical protein KatS3mg108_3120 [Isosphaeraceae bacterium]